MKNLTEIITAVLIILFLGFFVMRNCECCKSKCSVEEVETKETPTTKGVAEETTEKDEAVEEIEEGTDVDTGIIIDKTTEGTEEETKTEE